MNKKTCVLVVTHKQFDDSFIKEDCYKVIKVGNKLDSLEAKKMGYLTDDEGNNIAYDNGYYCELTAQYWAWKNIINEYDYIGIVHYRRFFFDYKKDSLEWRDDILTEKRIDSILQRYKIIISYLSVKRPGFSMLYKNKPDSEQDKHWIIIRDIIYSDYPEMKESFNKLIYGKKTIYGNMLIARREIYESYCEWIYDVLNKYDKEIESKGETRIPRVDGYLSEPLLLIWLHHNLKPNEIYHLEIRNVEVDRFSDYSKTIKGRFFRIFRHNRLILNLLQHFKIIYFLLTRK